MLRSSFSILIILCSLTFATVTCSISPTSWTWSSNDASTLTKTFTITNTGNETGAMGMIASGTVNTIFIFNPTTSQTLASGSSTTITASINPSGISDGSYQTTISLTGNCTNSLVASGIVGWKSTRNTFVSQGDSLNITPFAYKLNILQVSSGMIKFDLYMGTSKIESNYILETEQYYTEGTDLKITLIKSYSSGTAKLSISTSESDSTIESLSSVSDITNCKLQPSWNSRSYNVESGKTLTDNEIKIRNTCASNIDLQSISFSTAGNSLFTINNQGTKTLSPNEDFSIPIKIDATNTIPGDFTNTLVAMGYMGNNQMTVSIPISVRVGEGTMAYGGTAPAFTIQSTSKLNVDYVLQTNNVVLTDTIIPSFSPSSGVNCDPSTRQVVNNIWSLKCTFTKQGAYTVSIAVSRGGLPIGSSEETTVLVGLENVALNVNITNPLQLNTEDQIIVSESMGNTAISDASLTINNAPVLNQKFTPTAEGKYTICATRSPYQTTCADYILSKPKVQIAQVITIPSNPVSGEFINFTVIGVDGKTIDNPNIMVDGMALPAKYLAMPGFHSYNVTADGYADYSSQFQVFPVASIVSEPKDPKTGDILNFTFTDQTVYSFSFRKDISSPVQTLTTRQASQYASIDTKNNGAGYYIISMVGGQEKTYQVSDSNFFDWLNPLSSRGWTLGFIPNLLIVIVVLGILFFLIMAILPSGKKGSGGFNGRISAPPMGSPRGIGAAQVITR